MDTLLKAIRDELKAKLPYLNGAVYITPEGSEIIVLPREAKLPCVIVKDGREIVHHRKPGRKTTRLVRVTALVEIHKAEESIVGGSSRKGVVNILQDVDMALDKNTLGLVGYTIALLKDQESSDMVELTTSDAVRKAALYEYHEII